MTGKLKFILCDSYDLIFIGSAMFIVSMIPLTWIVVLKWAGVI